MIERVTSRTPSEPPTNAERWEARRAAYRAFRNIEVSPEPASAPDRLPSVGADSGKVVTMRRRA